jgi:hypothetical protein
MAGKVNEPTLPYPFESFFKIGFSYSVISGVEFLV